MTHQAGAKIARELEEPASQFGRREVNERGLQVIAQAVKPKVAGRLLLGHLLERQAGYVIQQVNSGIEVTGQPLLVVYQMPPSGFCLEMTEPVWMDLSSKHPPFRPGSNSATLSRHHELAGERQGDC